MKKYILCLLLILIVVFCGCKESGTPDKPQIAVSSSYLAAAVRDICGDDTDVLLLTPPGMCPGHFDISPSQISQLSQSRLLLVFDFQYSVADSLRRLEQKGLNIRSVPAPEGLCVPQNYVAVVKFTAELLSEINPEKTDFYQAKTEQIEERIKELSAMLRAKARCAKVCKKNAIVAAHQLNFANWLGVRVVSVFGDNDNQTAYDISNTLEQVGDADVAVIIANKQQGSAAADALANRFEATVVQWSNFPELGNEQNIPDFDKLVIDNVCNLLAANDG